MKMSLRARRMARNHKRLSSSAKLNLVSLMDIFTILVFFLMVNNGDVEVLSSDKNITLPESVSEQKPEATLTIKISNQDIIVQGRKIATIEQALTQKGNSLSDLGKELEYQLARAPAPTELEEQIGRSVIIMGDHEMPYKLLKRIMTTCAQTDYRDISLAVNSVPPAAEEEVQLAMRGG
jgi:biopolymer transport protein ExbD